MRDDSGASSLLDGAIGVNLTTVVPPTVALVGDLGLALALGDARWDLTSETLSFSTYFEQKINDIDTNF